MGDHVSRSIVLMIPEDEDEIIKKDEYSSRLFIISGFEKVFGKSEIIFVSIKEKDRRGIMKPKYQLWSSFSQLYSPEL